MDLLDLPQAGHVRTGIGGISGRRTDGFDLTPALRIV
jgi:hypothetical protein